GKIIIHSHHPLFYKRNVKARVDAFINELKLKSVPLMLHGHWHLDGVFNEQGVRQKETPVFSGIKFISTTAAGDKLRNYFDREKDKIYHGYRLIKFDDGEVTSYTFDLDKDGVDDAELSAPYGTVSSDYHQGVLTVVNHHNVELMLKPKLNFKDEHVCLEDGTKPYLSVKNKERWEHRFKLKLAKQSGKQIRVLPGAYCQ
ncbi:MAG: hypothetical protein ISR69_11920, partial [Gammaproteobacteria bacterium]|nr:hypothetical protein [Gammaproteobacteria bacterium]